jgi:hypothetical protein
VAVRERVAVVHVHREGLHAAGVDELRNRADEALPLVFAFVAAARREHDHRRSPVSVDVDAHLASEAMRVPAVIFVMHDVVAARPNVALCRRARLRLNGVNRAESI